MSVFELATLTFRPDRAPEGVQHVHKFLAGGNDGTLIGVWRSEISPQNAVRLLRGFDDLGALHESRLATRMSADPFGCSAELAGLSLETMIPFPGFEEVPPAAGGPYYEFRTYRVPAGGIAPTVRAWGEMVPRRRQVSPPTVIMYALDGSPRFTHVWAYPTLADRERLRAEALARGVWPPASAPRWLTADMRSEIWMPTDMSPLQ